MNIKTFHIDGKNRIIVNGVKLMWATLSDIMPYGDDETPLKNKFELFVLDKQNGNTLKKRKQYKAIKKRKDTDTKFTRKKIKVTVPKDDLLNYLNDEIEELTQFYYNKYKCIACIEIEDVRSEVIILLYEVYEKLLGSLNELTYGNKNTFMYIIKHRFTDRLEKRLGKYVYGISTGNGQSKELIKISSIHKNVCPLNDESYTNKEIVKYTENEYKSNCELDYTERDNIIALYNQIIHREENEFFELQYKIDDIIYYAELRKCIKIIFSTLSERDRDIMISRYGFIDNRPKMLEEVGKQFGVHGEGIRQIEGRVLRKLRHPSISEYLYDFLYD